MLQPLQSIFSFSSQIWSRKHSELHLQSSLPFATLFSALRHQQRDAHERGLPAGVPDSCWWADAIRDCDLAPVPVHPEPLTIDSNGVAGLVTILDGVRAASADYQCFWCQEVKPQKFKTATRAVKHLQTKHSVLWKGLSPPHKAALLDSPTPDTWMEVALSLSIHPDSEAGAQLGIFMQQLRTSVARKKAQPHASAPAAAAERRLGIVSLRIGGPNGCDRSTLAARRSAGAYSASRPAICSSGWSARCSIDSSCPCVAARPSLCACGRSAR
jgi:hypothetical protein